MSADLVADLATRLTARDLWLLHMLYEHRVLTTTQIAQLAFGATTTAAHRLHQLWEHRAVDRQQPLVERGSAPMHYILGDAGAAVLAAHHDITVRDLGYHRNSAIGILHSAKLTHTVGVNSILASLVAHARVHADARLATWWSERRCAYHWGDLARPDAYIRWQEGSTTVAFFLEYDTGTEPLRRLASKLADYADLAHVTGATVPVLFWFQSPQREANARIALHGTTVPLATGAPQPDNSDPATDVWLMLGENGVTRRSLITLMQAADGCAPAPDTASPTKPDGMGPWVAPVEPMPPSSSRTSRTC